MGFLAHIRQVSEGCDYTIGCGEFTWTFVADSWDDAIAELKRDIIGIPSDDDHPGFWDEKRLKSAFLVQIIRMAEMPVQEWYEEEMALRQAQEEEAEEMKERRQYERLKRKFEEGER